MHVAVEKPRQGDAHPSGHNVAGTIDLMVEGARQPGRALGFLAADIGPGTAKRPSTQDKTKRMSAKASELMGLAKFGRIRMI